MGRRALTGALATDYDFWRTLHVAFATLAGVGSTTARDFRLKGTRIFSQGPGRIGGIMTKAN